MDFEDELFNFCILAGGFKRYGPGLRNEESLLWGIEIGGGARLTI